MEGFIGLFNLETWWLNELTSEERKTIEQNYNPIGLPTGSVSLTKGKLGGGNQSKLSFISGLATWFKKPETYLIAKKILNKANLILNETKRIIDIHFYYQNRIEIFYRNRDNDKEALALAIEACEEQIKIAKDVALAFKREYSNSHPPMHIGYKQLSIIYEKQKKYTEVIKLCTQAKEEGWSGDWDNRIEKAKKKLIG